MRICLVALTLACGGLLPLSGSSAGEEDHAELKLLRPDSLAGWEYGQQAPRGWTMAAGELCANGDSAPLLSGFTFGNFRLRFTWSVKGRAAWEIHLPEVPSGPGLRLVLCEGEGCARLEDAGNALAAGSTLAAAPDGRHTAEIDRTADKLIVIVDGKQLAEGRIRADRRFGLGLAVTGGEARLVDLRLQEPAGEPLFNGKDLTGWWTPGDLGAWGVDKGQLLLHKQGGNYLRTEKEYANFTLSLEHWVAKGGNSGIGIRTPRPGWPSSDGMEVQLWDIPYDRPLDKHAAGAIYGNVPPLGRADKSGQFNRVAIKADGRMVSAWVNGELVQQYDTGDHPELKHRQLKGWIGIQDHGAKTLIRNLRVLEAPAGLGLDAWQRPRAPRGAEVLIDRLMNSERLAAADGVRSGCASARLDGESQPEHVLADLAGPGAVVRLARTSDDGRLTFYFDGEDRPRLECKPADLWHAAPPLAEDANPVLTCLAYRRGLKVVLRGARRGQWRIDYVTFPGTVAVETYTAPDGGIARGWLSAAVYRHEQFGWGVHREHEPIPRASGGPKTIQPGQRERLIRADGAGIVHWIKLQADKKVLNNNDLWLEATVDGETQPAVATPVRFWFPALVGQGNYPNYLLVDRGGVTNWLAMPFAKGIDVFLSNRGKRPIPAIGLTASVEPATAATREAVARRMRLRARFQPAGEDLQGLVHCEGLGRWLGLVYEEPKGTQTRIESLVVDGREADGWHDVGLDGFLGRGGDFRSAASGRRGSLAWRYLLLEPVDFRQSLVLKASGARLGDRLAVFYAQN